MAADPSFGNRFLVAPTRGSEWQARAVAGTGQAEGAIAAGHLGVQRRHEEARHEESSEQGFGQD